MGTSKGAWWLERNRSSETRQGKEYSSLHSECIFGSCGLETEKLHLQEFQYHDECEFSLHKHITDRSRKDFVSHCWQVNFHMIHYKHLYKTIYSKLYREYFLWKTIKMKYLEVLILLRKPYPQLHICERSEPTYWQQVLKTQEEALSSRALYFN